MTNRKALIVIGIPISKLIANSKPASEPADPAIAVPRANVSKIILSELIPTNLETVVSW
jgi:hypothetical protein